MYHHGLTASVSVRVLADDGPVVNPFHRLQVDNTTAGSYILKMDEPVFSGWRVNPRSLMRTIDGGIPLRQDDSFFIRTPDVFAA